MISMVMLIQNCLSTTNLLEMVFQTPSTSPLANQTWYKLPPTQGLNWEGSSGSYMHFQIPSISCLLDTGAGVKFGFTLNLKSPTQSYKSKGASSFNPDSPNFDI